MIGLLTGTTAPYTIPRFEHLAENQRPTFHAKYLTIRQEQQRSRMVAEDAMLIEKINSAKGEDLDGLEAQRLEKLAALLDFVLDRVENVEGVSKPGDLIEVLSSLDISFVYLKSIEATRFAADLAKNSESPSSSSEGGSAKDADPTPAPHEATAATTAPRKKAPKPSSA